MHFVNILFGEKFAIVSSFIFTGGFVFYLILNNS